MDKLGRLLALTAIAAAGSASAAPVLVNSAAALGANDSVNWSQLGSDGTALNQNFTANSANSVVVSGAFAGAGGGCLAVVGGSNCGWNAGPGFSGGDSVLWAEDGNYSGSGPLTLSFASALGAGLWVQATAPGAYSMSIEAFNGVGSLGVFSEASNLSGDGMFIGVLDTLADITSIKLTLTACSAGCDFAVNSLQLAEAAANAVPEPSSWMLVVLPLMSLPFFRRRQAGATPVNMGNCA